VAGELVGSGEDIGEGGDCGVVCANTHDIVSAEMRAKKFGKFIIFL
jgi:hypothetical protein